MPTLAPDYIARLQPGAPNLDAMNLDELYAFSAATRGVSPRRAARRMFSDQPGRIRATKDLNLYAWNRITAIACRNRGEIRTAQQYERVAERIYRNLPKYAQW